MDTWQSGFLLLFAFITLFICFKGFWETSKRDNPFGNPKYFSLFGIFAWADATIFGGFWFLVSLVTLFLQDWLLFLLIFFVFWIVRSLGETIYWFNQQFSTIERNPPKTLSGYRFFKNDSIWFVYQIFWQCITVISIILTIYFAHLWLK